MKEDQHWKNKFFSVVKNPKKLSPFLLYDGFKISEMCLSPNDWIYNRLKQPKRKFLGV